MWRKSHVLALQFWSFNIKYFFAEPETSVADPKGALHKHNQKHKKKKDPQAGVKKADASKYTRTGKSVSPRDAARTFNAGQTNNYDSQGDWIGHCSSAIPGMGYGSHLLIFKCHKAGPWLALREKNFQHLETI
jgi:hypothetical protein